MLTTLVRRLIRLLVTRSHTRHGTHHTLVRTTRKSRRGGSSRGSGSSRSTGNGSTGNGTGTGHPNSHQGRSGTSRAHSGHSRGSRISSTHGTISPGSPYSVVGTYNKYATLGHPCGGRLTTGRTTVRRLFTSLYRHRNVTMSPVHNVNIALNSPNGCPTPHNFHRGTTAPFTPNGRNTIHYNFFRHNARGVITMPRYPIRTPNTQRVLGNVTHRTRHLRVPTFGRSGRLNLLHCTIIHYN